MHKLSVFTIILCLSIHTTYAQSSVILPSQANFSTSSTDPYANAVFSLIKSTTPGSYSAAVRGHNNGTGLLGIGVYGSQAGSGWGVYGTTPSGMGVYGNGSNTGFGVYGTSFYGTAGKFEISNETSTGTALEVTNKGKGTGILVQLPAGNGDKGIFVSHSGIGSGVFSTSSGGMGLWGVTSSQTAAGVIGDNFLGEAVVGRNRSPSGIGAVVGRNDSTGAGIRGFNASSGVGVLGQAGISGGRGTAGRFENVNSLNPKNALEASTNGTGAGALIANVGTTGAGAGLIVQKTRSFAGAYTPDANADLEVRHPIVSTSGLAGFRILNTGSAKNSWTFYTDNSNGNLYLYFKDNYRGNFNQTTGAYTSTSDSRLKNNIQNYGATLANLVKIGVKSYQLVNSDKTEVGLIAQDALLYFPEIVYSQVNDKGEQFYTMDYSRIGVLAVKAIQEQQLLIDKQQTQIESLKAEMAALKQLVESSIKK